MTDSPHAGSDGTATDELAPVSATSNGAPGGPADAPAPDASTPLFATRPSGSAPGDGERTVGPGAAGDEVADDEDMGDDEVDQPGDVDQRGDVGQPDDRTEVIAPVGAPDTDAVIQTEVVADKTEVVADEQDPAEPDLTDPTTEVAAAGGGLVTLRRTARWWAPPVALVVLAAALVAWLFLDRAGEALPGVSVEDVDVSGMTGDQIDQELSTIVAQRRAAEVTATAGDQEFEFQLGEQGYVADVDAAVAAALSAGRDGPWPSVANHVAATFGRTWQFDLDADTVGGAVDGFVRDVAAAVDTPAFHGSVSIDPETAEVSSQPPTEGARLNREQARLLVGEVAGTGEDADVTLPVETLPTVATAADVDAAAEQASAVLAEPYVLSHETGNVTVEPADVADWLRVDTPDNDFALSLDEEAVLAGMEGRGEGLGVQPESASYEIVSGWRTYDNKGSGTWDPTPAQVNIVEGHNGTAYDPQLAADGMLALFEAGDHEGSLELAEVEPELTNEEAAALQPDSLLGTFTTYDACCGNRRHNIHRLADLVDNTMLLPGGNYSVNDSVGRRTLEKGFLRAGAIEDGQIVNDDVGGGISQFATTFYNAAFFAGIEVLEHRPHTLPISRYPLGREATFSYSGDVDINIRNNTEQGAIIVSTSYTSTTVTVSIFGRDDGRTVTAEMGSPHSYTSPDTRREPNPDLPKDTERVIQTGQQGFTVDYRRIIEGGVAPGTENYSWAYFPKPKIVEYGTG